MLSTDERQLIADNFWIYEHEWRFFSVFMGEPFLVDDHLVYWDGSTVNVCGFPLVRRDAILTPARLSAMIEALGSPYPIRLIHSWGNIAPAQHQPIAGESLALTNPDSVAERYPGEHTLDVGTFTLAALPEAAKAMRSATNHGVTVRHRAVQRFEAEHYRLVELWRTTRPIGSIAACATTALPTYCREQGVVFFEAFKDQRMRGFAVVSSPVPGQAIVMLSFSERAPGARIEDSLMHAIVDYCRDNDVATLHCGYAGTASLARFKEKWGARRTGPEYQQAIYASPEWLERAHSYEFYWSIRMINGVPGVLDSALMPAPPTNG